MKRAKRRRIDVVGRVLSHLRNMSRADRVELYAKGFAAIAEREEREFTGPRYVSPLARARI